MRIRLLASAFIGLISLCPMAAMADHHGGRSYGGRSEEHGYREGGYRHGGGDYGYRDRGDYSDWDHHSHSHFDLSLGLGFLFGDSGYHRDYCDEPRYYAPSRYDYCDPPVVYHAPVVVEEPAVVYAPPPVVYCPPPAVTYHYYDSGYCYPRSYGYAETRYYYGR